MFYPWLLPLFIPLWVLEVLLLVDFLTYITTLLVHTTFCFFFFPWNETFLVVAAASAWLNKSTSSKYRLFYTQQLQNFLYFLSSQKYTRANVLFSERVSERFQGEKAQQERKWKEVTILMLVSQCFTWKLQIWGNLYFWLVRSYNKNKCIEETRIIGFPCLAFLYNCTVGSLDLLL